MTSTSRYPDGMVLLETDFQIYEPFRSSKKRGLGALYKVKYNDEEKQNV